MGELPLELVALVDNLLMVAVKFQTLPFPVMGTFQTLREVPRLTLQLAQSALQELRVANSPSLSVMYFFSPKSMPTDAPLCVFPMD